MKRTILPAAILALALGALAPQPAAADQRMDQKQMNAALAAIIALGIGVAIAKHDRKHHSGWDEDLYGEPFSPSPNVVCLPKPRQCYLHSHFSARWTRRIFGN